MSTDVSTSFPEMVLEPGSTITVDAGAVGAKVTQLNVYGFTPTTGTDGEGAGGELSDLFIYAEAGA